MTRTSVAECIGHASDSLASRVCYASKNALSVTSAHHNSPVILIATTDSLPPALSAMLLYKILVSVAYRSCCRGQPSCLHMD